MPELTKESSNSRTHVDILERRLLQNQLHTIRIQEDYTDLIEDLLDELCQLRNLEVSTDYLCGSEELLDERERLHEALEIIRSDLRMEKNFAKLENKKKNELKAALADSEEKRKKLIKKKGKRG